MTGTNFDAFWRSRPKRPLSAIDRERIDVSDLTISIALVRIGFGDFSIVAGANRDLVRYSPISVR